MITLTNEERKKFAQWLEQEMEADRLLLAQMGKMKVPESLLRMMRANVHHKLSMVRMLTETETQTVSQRRAPSTLDPR